MIELIITLADIDLNNLMFISSSVVTGAVLFGVALPEIPLILPALFLDQLHYQSGSLFINFVLFSVSYAEISIIMTYLQLRNEVRIKTIATSIQYLLFNWLIYLFASLFSGLSMVV